MLDEKDVPDAVIQHFAEKVSALFSTDNITRSVESSVYVDYNADNQDSFTLGVHLEQFSKEEAVQLGAMLADMAKRTGLTLSVENGLAGLKAETVEKLIAGMEKSDNSQQKGWRDRSVEGRSGRTP